MSEVIEKIYKEDVLLSKVGCAYVLGTVAGSVYDFVNADKGGRLQAVRQGVYSTRAGRFMGLYATAALALNHGVSLCHLNRDLPIDVVTAALLLPRYGLRTALLGGIAVTGLSSLYHRLKER